MYISNYIYSNVEVEDLLIPTSLKIVPDYDLQSSQTATTYINLNIWRVGIKSNEKISDAYRKTVVDENKNKNIYSKTSRISLNLGSRRIYLKVRII